jgi:hypothetical protein
MIQDACHATPVHTCHYLMQASMYIHRPDMPCNPAFCGRSCMGAENCMEYIFDLFQEIGFKLLRFRDAIEPCIVCNGHERQLQFPADGCTHWFCLSCSRKIICWDSDRYCLDPFNYGCPPCPKGCINPMKGPQCDCEEYSMIQNTWRGQDPAMHKLWYDDEKSSIENGEEDGSAISSKTCPMCRRHV